jgi:hypothetical protein
VPRCSLCRAKRRSRLIGERGLHLGRAVTDDHDHRLRAGGPGRADRVHDQRLAEEAMQHLRQIGAHAGALARGEDDGDQRHGPGP